MKPRAVVKNLLRPEGRGYIRAALCGLILAALAAAFV